VVSYDQIRVTVETDERSITSTLSAQQAVASLMGLLMAASGCPFTRALPSPIRGRRKIRVCDKK